MTMITPPSQGPLPPDIAALPDLADTPAVLRTLLA